MSHYIRNITCVVLSFTLFNSCDTHSIVGLIITYTTGSVLFVYSFGSFGVFVLSNLSKLIEFTNFWNRFVYLIASSLLGSGQLPPAFIILFLRVNGTRVQRGLNRGDSVKIWGTELKLLLLEPFLYVPVINTGVCLYSVGLMYH
jgi:hypothetical protein